MMVSVRSDLPSGTVTFLFTDVEASTRLLHELGVEAYGQALAEHRGVLREAVASHGGVEFGTQGDAFFAAFPTAPGALQAAWEAQEGLTRGPLRVRMGLHTGTAQVVDEDYVGADVHLAARIAAAAHGGQVLVSAATAALVPREELAELGEHRLKDFPGPVRLFQVGPVRFPPLRTISNTNLPRPVSSFVGREREVSEVASLLREGARLLTLTGPGGSGKTRLGIEAASELVPEFGAGVFWVGLAPLRDPGLVVPTIAHTLGAENGLADHIGEREMLLLLDNLEHVVEAAPELSSLLEGCPNLRLLVTSRELLRVRGETEYPVPPLADPDAVELFSARAGAEPDETVAVLCQALENLPLALELAAARTAILSPVQILERLGQRLDVLKGGRDVEARQETLRAAIDWSHELLTAADQTLFARLAVFRGGCTLQAAEQVAEADLDVLQSLVDKSLLRLGDGRYRMLETIRQHAAEKLEASEEAQELNRRHAEWFLALAEEAEQHLRTNPKQWLDRLEAEHDNLRAALDRSVASEETQLALRLAGALAPDFWPRRGHLIEAQRRLERVLSADLRPTPARAKALNGAADLAEASGDLATARLRAEEALGLYRSLGDAWGVANSRWTLGGVLADEGDWAKAQELVEASVRDFRELGDEHNAMRANRTLAWTCHGLGQVERARELYEENLPRARALGDVTIEALMLGVLATMYAVPEGRFGEALSMLERGYRIHRELGDRLAMMVDLCRFAHALASAGRARTATRVLSASDALREEIGANVRWVAELNDDTLIAIRAHLDEAAFNEAWEQGRKLTIHEAVALALDSP